MADRKYSECSSNISCGLSQINCQSDEDRSYINICHNTNSGHHISSFGVFDGHMGSLAADITSVRLHDSVIGSYDKLLGSSSESLTGPEKDRLFCEGVRRSFQSLDENVKRHTDSGSTVISLFVTQQPDDSARVFCPWVGDSKCVMYQKCLETGEIVPLRMSTDHKPSLQREANRIDSKTGVMWSADPQELEVSFRKQCSDTDTVEETSSHSSEKDMNIKDVEEIKIKELEDEENMIHRNYKHNESFIERRGRDHQGPLAVHGRNGISLTMTRSIGDKYGPRSCVWVPDVSAVTIPANQHARFVLASDGMWDVLTVTTVQKLVYRFKNVQKVASLLSKRAWLKRMHLQMRPDDITVIVVDINPQSFQSYPRGISGCVPFNPLAWFRHKL
mmetsp:Transcript_1998/g.2079  ORF Transcript_1998/g.2079 Transcript_1998/m.2079 type:complete len:389 (-) Transcript_1998:494-1660(-)